PSRTNTSSWQRPAPQSCTHGSTEGRIPRGRQHVHGKCSTDADSSLAPFVKSTPQPCHWLIRLFGRILCLQTHRPTPLAISHCRTRLASAATIGVYLSRRHGQLTPGTNVNLTHDSFPQDCRPLAGQVD